MAHTKFPGCALLVHPTYPNMPKSCAKLVHQEHASITTIDEMQKVYIYIYIYISSFFFFLVFITSKFDMPLPCRGSIQHFLGRLCFNHVQASHADTHTHTRVPMILWSYDTLRFWDCDARILWAYDTLILWYCGTIFFAEYFPIWDHQTTTGRKDGRNRWA